MKKLLYSISLLLLTSIGFGQLTVTGNSTYFYNGVYNFCANSGETNFKLDITLTDASSRDANLIEWEVQYTDANGANKTVTTTGASPNLILPVPQSTSFVNVWYKKGTPDEETLPVGSALYIFAQYKPTIDLINTKSFCDGQSVTLTPSITNNNIFALYKYNWKDKNGDVKVNSSKNNPFIPADTGMYYFNVSYTLPENCETTDSVLIKNITPTADLGSDINVCRDQEVTVKNLWSPNPNFAGSIYYTWRNESPTTVNGFTTTSDGIVTLEVNTREGATSCTSNKAQVSLNLQNTPWVELGPDINVNVGPVMLKNTINNGSVSSNYNYSWIDESGVEIGFTQDLSVIKTGIYTLEITDKTTTCLKKDVVIVNIESDPIEPTIPVGGVIFVASAFSPEGNVEENRFLRVNGTNISGTDFNFTVRDRWGGVMYETDNPSLAASGWNGDGAPSGTYTYTVKGKHLDGSLINEAGTSTLIK